MELTQHQHVFLAGIGGVSMSGLAHALLKLGYRVSGSDVAEGEAVAKLRAAGATVTIGHAPGNALSADVVVRSTAVLESSPEIVAAREAGLPLFHRSELLAWMCRGKQAIALTGTHGKSTTTAMLATIFLEAGADPTVFVGAEMPLIGGNFCLGDGPHIIFEACESDNSFLNYVGCNEVLTSVEADHLDHHGDLEGVKVAFQDFVRIADPEGYLVYWADCPTVGQVASGSPARGISYGLSAEAHLRATDIRGDSDGTRFRLLIGGEDSGEVSLPVVGEHNALNALAALGCALGSGLDMTAACAALAGFRPVGRRFEQIANVGGVRIVDDYAHHPTEIRATLAAARASHPGRIVAIFQPHLRSRTRDLLADFSAAFRDADVVVLSDIYQAREDGVGEFDVARLLEGVQAHEPGKRVELIRDKAQLPAELAPSLKAGDLVLTIGAGDINKVGPALADRLTRGES